jgi:hypothetical protein
MYARLTLVTGLAATLFACSNPGDDLGDVLPDDRVLINLPSDEGASSARVGGWSEYYLFTAEVTDNVNGLAGFVLVLTKAIVTTQRPSTVSEDGNSATWGPYAGTLDPVATQLWVTRDAETGGYTWGYEQRPKNDETAEWRDIVLGEVDPGASREASRGRFTVDWTTANELDPNVNAVGTFTVDYDLGTEGVSGDASFDEVVFDGMAQAVDAAYHYEQIHDGEGAMDLAVQANLEPTSAALDETYTIRSRWLSDGQGRSDAYLTGGDLGENVATASECWDDMFQSIYYVDNYTPIEEGDVTGCAYAEPEYSESEEP